MKADEIRKDGTSGFETQENQAICHALNEIAAQLAEFNEISREALEVQEEHIALVRKMSELQEKQYREANDPTIQAQRMQQAMEHVFNGVNPPVPTATPPEHTPRVRSHHRRDIPENR